MALTPIGENFVRRCLAAQLELDRAKEEIQQFKGVGQGTVSIALSTAPHVSMLPRVLVPFQRRYPDVRLRITEGLFPTVEADIRTGAIDFYVGPPPEDSLGGDYLSEKLFDNQRVVLGRCNHPLKHATSFAELVGARWVATSVTVNSEAELHPLFQQRGLPDPKIAVYAQSALSMLSVAASSDVLAMLPRQWLSFAQVSGLLARIPIAEEIAAPPICMVSRTSLPLTPVAEYLSDLFRRAALNRA